jgi:hypothetical protein
VGLVMMSERELNRIEVLAQVDDGGPIARFVRRVTLDQYERRTPVF